uniref:Uncharacterized protein n=1 Tax=Pseudomonas fluorescens (strain SBW25) TaxID=216595 RepID=A0A0G4E4Q9_PSEFS|nr:hypothetical protein [Pseudomonas fluorescens]CEK42225.1 hypothetical protein PQBR57_0272 [Pseudomonas fluorescens SBW25]
MGSTVSTGKLIGAFEGPTGKPVYVMFEQTYDKRSFPREPRWSARMIGDLAATLQNIFLSAASCEGGMLQGAGGRYITPEGYLTGWMTELANPVDMPNLSFELTVGKYWEAAIPTDAFEKAKARLLRVDAGRIIDGLESGAVNASLYADCEALASIYDGMNLWASQIIKSHHVPLHGQRNSALGYKPAKAKVQQLETPRFAKIHGDMGSYLILGQDGVWRCEGGGHSYIADIVRGLWQDEFRQPGSYRSRIKAYRAAMDSAITIPHQTTTVIVNLRADLDEWNRESIDRVLRETPHSIVGDEAHIPAPADYNNLYWVVGLPEQCTKWVLGIQPVNAPTEQLCLLAG